VESKNMKNNNLIMYLLIAIVFFFVGRWFGVGNQKAAYGDSGFPKNCRALIAENIDGVRVGEFTPVDALSSIERNCGRYGLIWNER
jgi:hypothetical protein